MLDSITRLQALIDQRAAVDHATPYDRAVATFRAHLDVVAAEIRTTGVISGEAARKGKALMADVEALGRALQDARPKLARGLLEEPNSRREHVVRGS